MTLGQLFSSLNSLRVCVRGVGGGVVGTGVGEESLGQWAKKKLRTQRDRDKHIQILRDSKKNRKAEMWKHKAI